MIFFFFLILVFLLFGRPQDFFIFLAPYRLSLLFTILSFVLTIVFTSSVITSKIFSIKESKRYLIFFFIMIIGIPFAYHSRVAFNFIFLKYLSNILFFFLFLVNVNSIKKLKQTLFVICISTLFYAVNCLSKGVFVDGRLDSKTMYDPNDLAFFFVSLFPLFFLFIKKSEGMTKRILAISGVTLSIGVTVLTGSRGGALGLMVVFFIIIFTKIIIKKQSLKVLLLLILCFTLFYNINKINKERFQSLTNLSSDYNFTSETGRLEIWKRALRLTISNPITGVGVGCFSKAIGEQRLREGISPKWQAPHNSYVQVLTETGLLGFFVFFSLIYLSFKNFFLQSKGKISNIDDDPYPSIAGVLMIGFTGSLICAFFLSQAYSIIFTFYFSLSVVLQSLNVQKEENEDLSSKLQ